MMIAVFVAALVFGAIGRRVLYRARAKNLAMTAIQYRAMAEAMHWGSKRGPTGELWELSLKAAEYNRLADELERESQDLARSW